MTLPEAQALLFTGLPGPAGQLGLADAHFASRLKLLASLPDAPARGGGADRRPLSSRCRRLEPGGGVP